MTTSSPTTFDYILVLDDLPEFRHWLTDLLGSMFPDSQIDPCASIHQARLLLHQRHYDLALIDLGLPDGDGNDIILWLQQHSPATMSIVMTIFDDNPHLLQALCNGAQGYLLKDMEEAALQHYLQQLTYGIPAFSPRITHKLLQYIQQTEQKKQLDLSSSPLPLTSREKQVLIHLAQGCRVSDIACLLGLSVHTVSGYVKEIYRKLNICSRVQAVIIAQQHGLIDSSLPADYGKQTPPK